MTGAQLHWVHRCVRGNPGCRVVTHEKGERVLVEVRERRRDRERTAAVFELGLDGQTIRSATC